MVRELLEETRQASLDEPGRTRLAEIYQRAVGELAEVALAGPAGGARSTLAPPLEGVPTESEIRVAQAQLVGWLEGLFHGIQAAMFAQQAAARAQFEELRRRGAGQTRGPARSEPAPPAGPARRAVPLGSATAPPAHACRTRTAAAATSGAACHPLGDVHRDQHDDQHRRPRPRSRPVGSAAGGGC